LDFAPKNLDCVATDLDFVAPDYDFFAGALGKDQGLITHMLRKTTLLGPNQFAAVQQSC
jgi:hypothetical protein